MLCEALTFTVLRDELPRLMAPVHTIMAPTNEAWAKMDESVRARIRGSCASFSSGTCALASPRCRIYGNDCGHCGPPRFPPPLPMCTETCNWASDADCDGGGPGSEFRQAPGRRHCGLGTIRHM